MGKVKTGSVSVKIKSNVKCLYYKIKPNDYSDVAKEHLNITFALSVLRTYKKMFVKIPEELCQNLNRNSIAHGYHVYDSLSKKDVLKLFQLLKASWILKTFNHKNMADL